MPETVLICEDDDQMRRLISVVLQRAGYELREATHGQAALDELSRDRPDLVILDMHMPGMSGLDVLERIRDMPSLEGVPVLLLSGSKEALDPDWASRVGADAHLPKPFAVEDLDGAVRALLTG